jgi:hypothetical protein
MTVMLKVKVIRGLSNPEGSMILQGWVTVLANSYYGAIGGVTHYGLNTILVETANVSRQDTIIEGEALAAIRRQVR